MSLAGANERKPQPLDIYAGQRIRQRRAFVGMTQEDMAQQAGVTFQQVQKYERGTNRMSLSRASDLAEILGVKIEYFVEGFRAATGKRARGFAEGGQDGFEGPPIDDRNALEAVKILHTMPKAQQAAYLKMMRNVAKGFRDDEA